MLFVPSHRQRNTCSIFDPPEDDVAEGLSPLPSFTPGCVNGYINSSMEAVFSRATRLILPRPLRACALATVFLHHCLHHTAHIPALRHRAGNSSKQERRHPSYSQAPQPLRMHFCPRIVQLQTRRVSSRVFPAAALPV